MKQNHLLSLAAAAILVLGGCYAKQKQDMLKEDFRTEAVALPMSVKEIVVMDTRTGVEGRPLTLTGEAQVRSDSVQPALSDAHKAHIRQELARYFTPGQPPVTIHVEMLEGRQLFETTATRAKETASTELKLTLLDENGKTVITAWGKARPEVESVQASQAYSDQLFLHAINASLYAAARRIQKDKAP
jgi:hypothetical protein